MFCFTCSHSLSLEFRDIIEGREMGKDQEEDNATMCSMIWWEATHMYDEMKWKAKDRTLWRRGLKHATGQKT